MTPLLVEKFGNVNVKKRGSPHKIEGEVLKLRLVSLQEMVETYETWRLRANKEVGDIQAAEVGHALQATQH